jgi:hypothetical protein
MSKATDLDWKVNQSFSNTNNSEEAAEGNSIFSNVFEQPLQTTTGVVKTTALFDKKEAHN